jgi:hypothetical protein
MTERDLVAHLARFAGALRVRRVDVRLKDELDAAEALPLVDIFDRAEVHRTLRTALKVRRADWDTFDRVFAELWDAAGSRSSRARRRPPRAVEDHRGPPRWEWDGRRVRLAVPGARAAPEGETPGYSPDALLRRKPFDELNRDDVRRVEQLIARAAARLATRRSRRLVPSRRGGVVDVRRSLRRAVGTGAELVALARRERALEHLDLVLLCDTSGSMDPHTRFLLAFMMGLRRAARRAEVFVFNTGLTRLTSWLGAGRHEATLRRIASLVPDWSGGTKIGASLAEFVARHQNQMVSSRTIVVILSDGLDLGDPDVLAGAMRAIRRRARRVIWLNPLLGDARYRPTAGGMAAALPFVDHFASAHNLESLERLVPLLAA